MTLGLELMGDARGGVLDFLPDHRPARVDSQNPKHRPLPHAIRSTFGPCPSENIDCNQQTTKIGSAKEAAAPTVRMRGGERRNYLARVLQALSHGSLLLLTRLSLLSPRLLPPFLSPLRCYHYSPLR